MTGYLVDVGNTNQLCSAIASSLGDRVRRHKIADAALNGIRSRSSFDRMVVKTENSTEPLLRMGIGEYYSEVFA